MTVHQRVYNTAAPIVGDMIARYIVAQGAQESANYTSKFFKKYNAPFGYMYSKDSRYQIAPGTNADNGAPIAAYASVEDATRELCAWLIRRTRDNRGGFPKSLAALDTSDKYVSAIKAAGYFQGSESVYAKNVAWYLKRLTDFAKNNGGLLSVIIVLVVIYYITK